MKAKQPKAREAPESIGADARGKVRVYADIDKAVAVELAVLAIRRGVSKKALLELLILEAVRSKH
jgi:hypothetical protein